MGGAAIQTPRSAPHAVHRFRNARAWFLQNLGRLKALQRFRKAGCAPSKQTGAWHENRSGREFGCHSRSSTISLISEVICLTPAMH
jgi:hypothetical protein